MTDPDRMAAAVRAGCAAADVHLRCSYPDCSCVSLPKAIIAAAEFLLGQQENPKEDRHA